MAVMDVSKMLVGVPVCEAHAPKGYFCRVERLLSLTVTCDTHPGHYGQINICLIVPSKRLD